MSNVRTLGESVEGAFGSAAIITKDIPFSLNYSDMIGKCDVRQTIKTKSITSTEAEEQLESNEQTASVGTLERLDTELKHKVVNVLRL